MWLDVETFVHCVVGYFIFQLFCFLCSFIQCSLLGSQERFETLNHRKIRLRLCIFFVENQNSFKLSVN